VNLNQNEYGILKDHLFFGFGGEKPMYSLSRFSISLVMGIILGAFIAWGHGVLAERPEDEKALLPLEELHTFTEIFTRIKQDYVVEVSDKDLIEYAIKGMLDGLDPHSSYLNEDAFTEMQIGTSGEFGGLGIEVGMHDGFVKVIAPIDDTPAQRAGVRAGDLIVRLDTTPVKGMTLNDAVKIMRGKPGSEILLTVVREGEDKPLQIKIIRDIIKVRSVRSRTLESGYGYVRISQFQSHTRDDLHTALEQLLTENKQQLNGLVLDLRNNPGGVLNAAVEVADTFLTKGLIVYTEGRVKNSALKFKARPKDMLAGTPMVILVNGGSASASEIVAGALQDHKRAIIMGTKTFGKGSVQTILPMQGKSALKLTTARYFTPNGRSIQAEGIVPDIIQEEVEIAAVGRDKDKQDVTEADLPGHLSNGEQEDKNNTTSNTEATKTEEEELPLIQRDYQLYEALNLLKGLNIVQRLK
jgi:carboxyl-terminal processing protease